MKRISMIGTYCVLYFLLTQSLNAQEWKVYVQPEEAGFNGEKLKLAEAQFSKMRSSSFMVIHRGNVLVSWGDVSRRFMAHSIRKSFMSAIYGIYTDRSAIDLNKTLESLGINDKGGLSALEKTAQVKDLITARSGIYHPAAYEPRSMKENRPKRGSKKPGEAFFYNNWDFNALHTILQKEANIEFFEAFITHIAKPLGMEDLRKQDMRYRVEPDLSNHSAYLFKMSARDMARFGQLYLDEGKWNGERIISKNWIKESTTAFTKSPKGFPDRSGYGYLWWIDDKSFGEKAYYASGLGGHRMYIFPQSDLVIVHQVNSYLSLYEADENIVKLVQLVLAAKNGKASKKPALKKLEVNKPKIKEITLSTAAFSKYTGTYTHPFFRKISVEAEDGKFYVRGEILGNFRIFPTAENEFVIEDLPELPLVFEPSSQENPRGTSTTKSDERRRPTAFVIYY